MEESVIKLQDEVKHLEQQHSRDQILILSAKDMEFQINLVNFKIDFFFFK